MPERLTRTGTFATRHFPAEAQRLLAEHFGRRVRRQEPGRLSVRTGSLFLMQALGTVLSPVRWLPARMTIDIEPRGDGSAVTVTSVDHYGFGRSSRTRARYEELFAEQLAEVRRVVG